MKYFLMTIDSRKIGVIETFLPPYNLNFGDNSYIKVASGKPIDYPIEFPTFVLKGNTPVTDNIMHVIGGNFKVFSKKFFGSIKGLDLDFYQKFPIRLFYRKKLLENYYAVYFPYDGNKYIDWENSVFLNKNLNDFKDHGTEIQFSSFEEFKQLYQVRRPNGIIFSLRKLKFLPNCPHLFHLRYPVGANYFASEVLKIRIEENKLRGFNFLDSESELVKC